MLALCPLIPLQGKYLLFFPDFTSLLSTAVSIEPENHWEGMLFAQIEPGLSLSDRADVAGGRQRLLSFNDPKF